MQKLQSPIAILQKAFKLLIQPRAFNIYMCAGILPQAGISVLFLVIMRLFLTNTYIIDTISESNVFVLTILVLVLLIFMLLFGTWYYTFMMHVHRMIATNKYVGYDTLIRASWMLTGRVIRTNIIRVFMLLIGYTLFLVPGIILTIWYHFSAIIAAVEHPSLSPLRVSKQIVRINFWPVAGRMLFFGLIYAIPYVVFKKVSPIISNIWLLTNPFWGLVQMVFYLHVIESANKSGGISAKNAS